MATYATATYAGVGVDRNVYGDERSGDVYETETCRATEKARARWIGDRLVQHEQEETSRGQEGEIWITRDAVSSVMRSQGVRVRAPPTAMPEARCTAPAIAF